MAYEKFFPFSSSRGRGSFNLDFDEAFGELELSKPQAALLRRILEQMMVICWFTDDSNDKIADEHKRGPRIELWHSFDDSGEELGHIDLEILLEALVEYDDELTPQEEIVAWKKIAAICELAIAKRQEVLDQDAAAVLHKVSHD